MGTFKDAAEFKIPRHIVIKNGVNVETVSTVVNLAYTDSQVQVLNNNAGTDIDCYLPDMKNGAYFYIRNSGADEIHVRDVSTTYKQVEAGKTVMIACTGSEWVVVSYA